MPRDEITGGHIVGDREREVLPHGRVCDHVGIAELGGLVEQLVEVELEHAPDAVERSWMELADDP